MKIIVDTCPRHNNFPTIVAMDTTIDNILLVINGIMHVYYK